MALVAMRQWRAAPGRVTPILTGLLQDRNSEVRSAALHAVAASLTASRLAADELAAVLDDPELGAAAATALGSVGDHRAVPHLVRLMLSNIDEPRLAEAFKAVARAAADPQAPVAAARLVLAALPDSCEPGLPPMRVLAAFGSAAAAAVPELIARLDPYETNRPAFMSPMKSANASWLKPSIGPVGSLESRISTRPCLSRSSTQLPLLSERPDLRHSGPKAVIWTPLPHFE
jgi:hypothetical protein